jgi:ribosomal protein L7/L12
MAGMESALSITILALVLLAVGLLVGGAASRERRTTARLVAIDRKLQVIMDSLGLADPAEAVPAVRHHVDRGEKIQAIRAYREATGVGLAEAKEAVEAIAEGRRR